MKIVLGIIVFNLFVFAVGFVFGYLVSGEWGWEVDDHAGRMTGEYLPGALKLAAGGLVFINLFVGFVLLGLYLLSLFMS